LFTLKIERVPIRAVLKELEKTGAVFVVDEAALKATGKSLDDPVSLDVQKADADTFFKALLGPMDLRFEIDNLTVTIRAP
jgi:ribosomal protein S19E (S16A)